MHLPLRLQAFHRPVQRRKGHRALKLLNLSGGRGLSCDQVVIRGRGHGANLFTQYNPDEHGHKPGREEGGRREEGEA